MLLILFLSNFFSAWFIFVFHNPLGLFVRLFKRVRCTYTCFRLNFCVKFKVSASVRNFPTERSEAKMAQAHGVHWHVAYQPVRLTVSHGSSMPVTDEPIGERGK